MACRATHYYDYLLSIARILIMNHITVMRSMVILYIYISHTDTHTHTHIVTHTYTYVYIYTNRYVYKYIYIYIVNVYVYATNTHDTHNTIYHMNKCIQLHTPTHT